MTPTEAVFAAIAAAKNVLDSGRVSAAAVRNLVDAVDEAVGSCPFAYEEALCALGVAYHLPWEVEDGNCVSRAVAGDESAARSALEYLVYCGEVGPSPHLPEAQRLREAVNQLPEELAECLRELQAEHDRRTSGGFSRMGTYGPCVEIDNDQLLVVTRYAPGHGHDVSEVVARLIGEQWQPA